MYARVTWPFAFLCGQIDWFVHNLIMSNVVFKAMVTDAFVSDCGKEGIAITQDDSVTLWRKENEEPLELAFDTTCTNTHTFTIGKNTSTCMHKHTLSY